MRPRWPVEERTAGTIGVSVALDGDTGQVRGEAVKATRTVTCGSLPFLRMGTKPAESWCATAPPRMKPRASMPATLSIRSPRNGAESASTLRAKPSASASKVVMSRNMMPGLG